MERKESIIPKSITFIVTKDCQLACKYCYLVGKNNAGRMTFDTAKKAVDYLTGDKVTFNNKSVLFDFIGGEPLLEIELIDKICDYIKHKLYTTNHKWFENYRFAITTNGLMYNNEKVQQFIKKNIRHLDITISIDGVEKKHDIQRIYPNGRGSYKDVVKNITSWVNQFHEVSTKVTISSDDIPYITESVLHIWDLGITHIYMNTVNENVWKDDDEILYENELIKLADTIIDNNLFKEKTCSIFNENVGRPLDPIRENKNWCGTGSMIAIDEKGYFYPCLRFADYSLRSKKPIIIGDIENGINHNLLRPFLSLDRKTQNTPECFNCEIASGCSWCQGENYDSADTNTIFQRSMAICKMHKAAVKANNYYWSKLYLKLDKEERELIKKNPELCCNI